MENFLALEEDYKPFKNFSIRIFIDEEYLIIKEKISKLNNLISQIQKELENNIYDNNFYYPKRLLYIKLIYQRKQYLSYLKKTSYPKYKNILKEYNLQYLEKLI